MALSKPSFLQYLAKTLTKPYHHHPPPTFLPIRHFSFATPEEAAAERRKRKRRLRIEPPLSSLRSQTQSLPQPQNPQNKNLNAPKLPDPISALSGSRLTLHNNILNLIRQNDLEEAALFTRHSIYSNCRPTIYTCNAVLAAQLRQAKYSELLSLHRFITQAGVSPNVVTHNILLTVYLDCKKIDLALEQYKQLIHDAPFNPSPTTYRILVKGLVDNRLLEKAIEIKSDMEEKGYKPDPVIYSYLMLGEVKEGNAEGVFNLYEELKSKLGVGQVLDGVVYGNLMKAYFLKGMEIEAMECYERVLGEGSGVKMTVVAYNYVLEALSKNGKFDEALKLFGRMKEEHDYPKRLSVDLGSYNIVVEGYCAEKRFSEAIEVFNSMGEKGCRPDTLSYNVLIDQLCCNDKLAEAEELYYGMSGKKVSPDEYTFVTLMDTCFKENRPDDAAQYFRAMVEAKLRPNMDVYSRLVEGLVKVGQVDVAKSFFDLMVPKLRMNVDAYKFIMNALFEAEKHDNVLKTVDWMIREEPNDFTEELEEYVRDELRKVGRDDEVTNLKTELERERVEAAAKAAEEAEKNKLNSTVAFASLFDKKDSVNKQTVDVEAVAGSDAEASEVIYSNGNMGDEETVEAEIVDGNERGTA